MNPHDGSDIWVEEIGPTYPTLAPSGDLVLVNTRQPVEKSDRGRGLIGCYELSLEGAQQKWVLPDEMRFYIPLSGDTFGRTRYTLQGNRAFIAGNNSNIRDENGVRRKHLGAFAIVDAETGEILVEETHQHNAWNVGINFWYVAGDRIYSSYDRHHSPNRGGRKPMMLRKWSDNHIELMGDEHGPYALDLANITGGYEVTMEHPIVDGLMFERTTHGQLVCYDMRQQGNEQRINLSAQGAWRGLGAPVPLKLRVTDGTIISGAAFPGSQRLIAQVYSTSRKKDFWRDFPVNDLTFDGKTLRGFAPIDTVGEALPHNYIGLNLDLVVDGDQVNGTWSRSIPPVPDLPQRSGSITGSTDTVHRFANTPWLKDQPKTNIAPLKEGQTAIVLTLNGGVYRPRGESYPSVTVSLVHDGTTFTQGSACII